MQLGWLHARPKRNDKDTNPIANLEKYHELHPIRHPPRGDEYVAAAFVECGMRSFAGMGEVPLTWQEINAYSQSSGRVLTSWEARMVRTMSQQYLNQKTTAERLGCREPWIGWKEVKLDQEITDEINESMSNML